MIVPVYIIGTVCRHVHISDGAQTAAIWIRGLEERMPETYDVFIRTVSGKKYPIHPTQTLNHIGIPWRHITAIHVIPYLKITYGIINDPIVRYKYVSAFQPASTWFIDDIHVMSLPTFHVLDGFQNPVAKNDSIYRLLRRYNGYFPLTFLITIPTTLCCP